MQRKHLRRMVAPTTAALLTFSAGAVLADPGEEPSADVEAATETEADSTTTVNDQADEASQATIDISITGTTVLASSDKDLSNVRVGLADGTVELFDGLTGQHFEHTFDQDVLWVTAKSGTTVRTVHAEVEADLGSDTEVGTDDEVEGDTEVEGDGDTDIASEADLSVNVDGRIVVVTSDKDISNVYVGLADGTVKAFDGLTGYHFEHTFDQDVLWVIAKSGTTVHTVAAADVTITGAPGYWDGTIDSQFTLERDTTTDTDVDTDADVDADVGADADADLGTDADVDFGTDAEVDAESDGDADVTGAETADRSAAPATVLGTSMTAPSGGRPELTATATDTGELPNTGSPLTVLAAIGGAAIAGGVTLRRIGR